MIVLCQHCGEPTRVPLGDYYPEYPGYSNDSTSLDAADYIAPKVTDLQMLVYSMIRDRPQTSYEIRTALGMKHQTISPRCTELKQYGLIEATGERRKTDNATAEVYRAVRPLSGLREKIALLEAELARLVEVMQR